MSNPREAVLDQMRTAPERIWTAPELQGAHGGTIEATRQVLRNLTEDRTVKRVKRGEYMLRGAKVPLEVDREKFLAGTGTALVKATPARAAVAAADALDTERHKIKLLVECAEHGLFEPLEALRKIGALVNGAPA